MAIVSEWGVANECLANVLPSLSRHYSVRKKDFICAVFDSFGGDIECNIKAMENHSWKYSISREGIFKGDEYHPMQCNKLMLELFVQCAKYGTKDLVMC